MKTRILLGIVTTALFTNIYAGQSSNELCSQISGHWKGIYTLKNPNDCKIYGSCTHLVFTSVSYVAGNEYHVNLRPVVGEGGEFNISCENGTITSPVNPGNKITAECDQNICYLTYDDARLSAEMTKY